MREAAVHRRLEWEGATADMPRAVVKLTVEQVAETAINSRMRHVKFGGDAQGVDGLTRGVGIGLESGQLPIGCSET